MSSERLTGNCSALLIRDQVTLRRAGQKRGVVLLTRSKEDECPSVSLDLSCDSSSFDSDDCATRAEKVSDLVLPHILGVSPCNYDKDRRSNTLTEEEQTEK